MMIEEEVLEESIKAKLSLELPKGLSYPTLMNSHRDVPVFNSHWGRGVLTSVNGHYDSIIGTFGPSHSELKNQREPGESTEGTFYYGYDGVTRTLHLIYATDTTFEFNNKTIGAIINRLRETSGFFHGMTIVR